jgi:hypothetical protein
VFSAVAHRICGRAQGRDESFRSIGFSSRTPFHRVKGPRAMNEYHPSASAADMLAYSSTEASPAQAAKLAIPTRTFAKPKLSPYECFFGMLLLGLVGIPLCFELYHLNPTPREQVTLQVERLGGRIQFNSPAAAETTVFIDFAGRPIINSDLACLERLATVDRLDLSRTSITDAGLRYVDELAALHELDLSHTAVTDAGLQALRGVGGLRRLSLTATRLTDAAGVELSTLPDLQELNLEYTDVGDGGLRALAKCKNLKLLYVGHTLVSPEALTAVRTERPDLQVVP